MYYNETINCDCPPRCTELSFEKFVSTGQELQQCSILTATGSTFASNNHNKAAADQTTPPPSPDATKNEDATDDVDPEYKVDK